MSNDHVELTGATLATIERLASADWFVKVGVRDTEKAMVLRSWAEACAYAASSDWENIGIEAANRLCEQILSCSKPRFQLWNGIVDRIKPIIVPLVEQKCKLVSERELLPKQFLDAVKWDILHVCMEAEYSDIVPPGFYSGTAYWYVVGHFPCGWEGELPAGRPIIF